jgi:uncharacterized protein (DUF1810 family)
VTGLERFVEAQDAGSAFESALAELRSGRKRGHWIWFVFPQLSGLGMSHMSRRYALTDPAEAEAYLRHPVLRARLLAITTAAADQIAQGRRLDDLMGSSVDAVKLISSLTLFGSLARHLAAAGADDGEYAALAVAADTVLAAGTTQGHPPCRHTLGRLNQ